MEFKNEILNNELSVFKTTTVDRAGQIELDIQSACEEINAIDVSSLNLADTINIGKELRAKLNTYKETRIGFFKPLNNLLKNFNNIDKAYDEKLNELKEHHDKLTEAQRLQDESNRRTALVIALEGLILGEIKNDMYKHFDVEIDNYIEKEKTRNILTESGKLKKAEFDKLNSFIDNLSTGIYTLSAIGTARFKSNGLNLADAIAFEKEQMELARQTLATEQQLQEQGYNEVQEKVKESIKQFEESKVEEVVEISEEVRERTLKIKYTPDKAELIGKLVNELRASGVIVEVQK